MPLPLTPPKRILLIRLSAFGDVVIATGLLHGLKRAYPDAEIDWLVQPEFAELLGTQAAITTVQVWPRKQWGKLWRGFRWLALWQAIRIFYKALRARDYDWVIDAQGLAKSRVLAGLAGGLFRIGYVSKEPLSWLLQQTVQRHAEGHPARMLIGSEHQPMANALGLGALPPPCLTIESLAEGTGASVVLAPFTTRPQKHWPESHWRQLMQLLIDRRLSLQLLGGPADHAAASRLLEGLPAGVVENLVGRTSYIAAAKRIGAAQALIGVDTGLTHLAAALGRPTVAIFGSTLPYASGHPKLTAALVVISQRLPCGPCARAPSCNGRWDCLRQITPLAIEASLISLLPQSGTAGL